MVAYTSGSPGIEGFPKVGAATPWGEGPGIFKVGFDFDWAAIHAARAAAGLPALVAGDTITLGQLPVGAYIVCSGINVTKANGVAAAVSLAIGGAAFAIATGTVGWTDGGVGGAGAVTAANIVLTLTALPTTGKARVVLMMGLLT